MAGQVSLIRQAAAVPLREGKLCLVSSRNKKRWVVPKGNVEPGKSTGEVALQEAWEEAGLVGLLQHEPLGSYLYEKDNSICHVIVFRMLVTSFSDTYPEMAIRQRLWVPLVQADLQIEDHGLREIIRDLKLSLGEVEAPSERSLAEIEEFRTLKRK